MKTNSFCFFLFLSLLAMNCSNQSPILTITVGDSRLMEHIPSGSGMAYIAGSSYIISDDSPYLFQLNHQFEVIRKISITKGFDDLERIEKALKPDFESLAVNESEKGVFLYGFGSGSLAGKRDSLVVLNIDKDAEVNIYHLKSFYEYLETLVGGVNRERINIEGAVINSGSLYLLNRGNNSIIMLNLESFHSFLNGKIEVSSLGINIYEIELPKQDGVFIGFSGCTMLPGTENLIFTATVENTTNWIDDGEILGSYVGVLSLKNLEKHRNATLVPLEVGAKPLLDKIESIAIRGEENGEYTALAVADNDDGSSKIFKFKITYK